MSLQRSPDPLAGGEGLAVPPQEPYPAPALSHSHPRLHQLSLTELPVYFFSGVPHAGVLPCRRYVAGAYGPLSYLQAEWTDRCVRVMLCGVWLQLLQQVGVTCRWSTVTSTTARVRRCLPGRRVDDASTRAGRRAPVHLVTCARRIPATSTKATSASVSVRQQHAE